MSELPFALRRSAPAGRLACVALTLAALTFTPFALAQSPSQQGGHDMSGHTMPDHTMPGHTMPTPAQAKTAQSGAAPTPSAPLPLRASAATVVAVPPGIGETSVFLTLTNTGAQPLKITGARAEVAGRATLMNTVKSGAMTGMKTASALVVPARGRLTLSATGDHVMLTGLKRSLKVGETLKVVLSTGDGRSLTVNATVRKP